MSEAILYAINAPQITDAAAAAEFVERRGESNNAPTEGIVSFFEQLLEVWPEDGSKGAVWCEGFEHNQPTGSVLEMTFDLSEFDEERLGHLRAIAGRHGVHIFDPEGEVLYLADGSESAA